MTITEAQEKIIREFAPCSDWMARYEHLIRLGRSLPAMPDHMKKEANLIPGCQSRVWLVAEKENDRIRFHLDSDALITRGIIALLLRVLNHRSVEAVRNARLYFLERIGLTTHLSPSRVNGVKSILGQMKRIAGGDRS